VGSIVEAACSCGFQVRMPLGGGINSFRTLAQFPALCRGCGGFQVVNLCDARLRCPGCGSLEISAYDDPSLAGDPGGKDVFGWSVGGASGRVVRLTDGTYRCPRCGESRLRFADAGFWD
jgi:predicted RNA-binding Zn-ribbon protein involved in translation (DUF1610 family)